MNFWFRLMLGKIERATKDAAAFDVFYSGNDPIYIGNAPVLLKTGIYTEFDPRLVAILKERSGLGLKGVEIKAGVIDSDYRKEWGVVARFPVHFNLPAYEEDGSVNWETMKPKADWKPFFVAPGDKIAQFLLVEKPIVEIMANSELAHFIDEGRERKGGFGSTDKPKAPKG